MLKSSTRRIQNINNCLGCVNTTKLIHGYGYVDERHFQQYFSYNVAISFNGGGNRSTLRKPQTSRKSLTNFIR
jgi:hypothetical protein